MTIMTDTKATPRFVALREISLLDDGIKSAELSEEFQELFGLEPGDASKFIEILRLIEAFVDDKPAMEAAFVALGIDIEMTGTLHDRRNALLDNRYGMRWDTQDSVDVEIQEVRGLTIITSGWYDIAYELATETTRRVGLATKVAAIADSQSTGRNTSKALNEALDSTDSRV